MNERPIACFHKTREGVEAPYAMRPNPAYCAIAIAIKTPKDATAAPREAAQISADSRARIPFPKMELVSLRFAMFKPLLSTKSTAKQPCSLAFRSNAEDELAMFRSCTTLQRSISQARRFCRIAFQKHGFAMKQFRKFQKSQAGAANMACTAVHQRGTFSIGYKLLMSGNQSFNRSLYVPLTRTSLICTRKFTSQGRCI